MAEMKGGKREGEHKGEAESEALISIAMAPESSICPQLSSYNAQG